VGTLPFIHVEVESPVPVIVNSTTTESNRLQIVALTLIDAVRSYRTGAYHGALLPYVDAIVHPEVRSLDKETCNRGAGEGQLEPIRMLMTLNSGPRPTLNRFV
jgi:hypothetical protein